jgi:hypothetical protein
VPRITSDLQSKTANLAKAESALDAVLRTYTGTWIGRRGGWFPERPSAGWERRFIPVDNAQVAALEAFDSAIPPATTGGASVPRGLYLGRPESAKARASAAARVGSQFAAVLRAKHTPSWVQQVETARGNAQYALFSFAYAAYLPVSTPTGSDSQRFDPATYSTDDFLLVSLLKFLDPVHLSNRLVGTAARGYHDVGVVLHFVNRSGYMANPDPVLFGDSEYGGGGQATMSQEYGPDFTWVDLGSSAVMLAASCSGSPINGDDGIMIPEGQSRTVCLIFQVHSAPSATDLNVEVSWNSAAWPVLPFLPGP